jgi:ligand-binding SRPBCC domain-containing protein
MTRVIAEQWVAVPLKSVFRFFSDPKNLPRLMPSAQKVHIDELRLVEAPSGEHEGIAAAGVGSEIVVSLRPIPWLPFRARWTARIVEYVPDEALADEQVRGPFRGWQHRHEFRQEKRDGQAGTVVREVVEFDAGWGWVGRVASFLIARQVRNTFRCRQSALESLLTKSQKKA